MSVESSGEPLQPKLELSRTFFMHACQLDPRFANAEVGSMTITKEITHAPTGKRELISFGATHISGDDCGEPDSILYEVKYFMYEPISPIPTDLLPLYSQLIRRRRSVSGSRQLLLNTNYKYEFDSSNEEEVDFQDHYRFLVGGDLLCEFPDTYPFL